METRVRCMHVLSSTSELDGERYIHNSSILWWNYMKLGEYVDDTIGHLFSFEYMSDFAWNLFYAGHRLTQTVHNCPQHITHIPTLIRIIECKCAHTVPQLGEELCIPDITTLLARFLFEEQHKDDNASNFLDNPEDCYDGTIKVVNSASGLFYAPSDVSGINGMEREFICSTPLWRNKAPCYDCAFVSAGPETGPMNGLEVVCILTFFSFHDKGLYYPCAAVHWFNHARDRPDKDTGMWLVCLQFNERHQHMISIIHIDSIYQAAHFIPVYGKHFVPMHLQPHHSYDGFHLFYINKFADYYAFEIAS